MHELDTLAMTIYATLSTLPFVAGAFFAFLAFDVEPELFKTNQWKRIVFATISALFMATPVIYTATSPDFWGIRITPTLYWEALTYVRSDSAIPVQPWYTMYLVIILGSIVAGVVMLTIAVKRCIFPPARPAWSA